MVEGFKHTDAGLIPYDWECTDLNSISEKIMVGIASAATHAYRQKGVVLLRNQNIKNGYLDDNYVLYVSEDYERTFINKRLKEGDLITARTGYPGATCLIPQKYVGAQSFTTLITRLKSNKVSSPYLNHYINSEQGQSFFTSNQIGGSQKNVNAGTLKKMPIVFPPTKAEQTAIATALNDADALINHLEQLLTKKRNIKTGAMQELLNPKEGWEVKKLGDLGEVKMCRRVFNHETQSEGTIPFYKIGTFGKEADAYISEDLYNSYRQRFSFPKKGDILISAAGTIGRTLIYDGKPAYFQDSNIVWIDNNESLISNKFLYFVFHVIKYNTEGGTIQRLYNNILKSTKFICPPAKAEQNRIVQILSDMDNEIRELERKLDKYKMLKQGMMQSLLTGKIRLVLATSAK